MTASPRLLVATLSAVLLLSATGCHYDYSYTSIGYGYGYSYDCSPTYHTRWGCSYNHPRYHAPCDGIRYRTDYVIGHGHHGHHVHYGR